MAGLTTVTSGGISDGTITNADINASAAIDASKVSGLSTDSITEGNTTVEVVDTGSDGHITFDTEGSERMRIDSSGNVGIKTTSPNCELHVGNPSANPSIEISRGAVGDEHGYRLFGADGAGNVALKFLPVDNGSVGSETMRIDSSGNVGIGTSSPSTKLEVEGSGVQIRCQLSDSKGVSLYGGTSANSPAITFEDVLRFFDNSSGAGERMRIDSSGRLLIGATTTYVDTPTGSGGFNAKMYIAGSANNDNGLYMSLWNNSTDYDTIGVPLVISRSKGGTVGTFGALSSGNSIGTISFNGDDGDQFVSAAAIEAAVDGTPGNNDMPGRLVFSTTADGASSPTERMTIKQNGDTFFTKTSNVFNSPGFRIAASGLIEATVNAAGCLNLNRTSDDGGMVGFYQDGIAEGNIDVNGSSISYNGAHLSRWSQLAGGAERIEILRGSVLSNLDEMCEWGEEDNEQLNRMKVSDVEGDRNVSGVFQSWDNDDDVYTNDFYCAMTGDFVIRIAQGTTVACGDLLMSAGDGTAKPQDDDIVRSKTIAKVTSTTVSTTYDDGSYCVPCVLMAC